MKDKKFFIIDAMALAYRAYYAFIGRPLVSSKGEPTSAVYGFVNQILRILEVHQPDYIAVAFDSPEKTFRHEKFESYKSSRQEMPDDMKPQINRIKQVIEILNIPIYILPRYEADDIIGTAAKHAEQAGLLTYVVTPDKDFNQMITERVRIVRPGKTTDEIIVWDRKKVLDEFGFEPKQMIDYLALIGDKSDDIPGVAGIGPKGAVPLIQQYGSVESIYEHIEDIEKAGIKNKLLAGKEDAIISKDLATIFCEVPIDFDFEKAILSSPDFDKLRDVFVELEFKALYTRLLNVYGSSAKQSEVKDVIEAELSAYDSEKVNYKLITSIKEAEELATKLMKAEQFVFDTETDGLDQFVLKIAGASFALKPGEAYFVAVNPFETKVDLFSKDLPDWMKLKDFIKIFKPVFENKSKKICQNGKYDIAVLRTLGIEVKDFYFDTMLAAYILDPDQKHGMDELARKYLNYNCIPISTLIGNKKDPSIIFDADLNELSTYAAEDADVTLKLFDKFAEELEKEKLTKLAFDVEFPLVEVLEDMEREGIKVDEHALHLFSDELQVMIVDYTKKIFDACGTEFNINSPKQMQEILFDKLGLSTGKKTKTGFSTDARSLEAIRGEHEVVDYILDYRQITKLKSTYADSLPNLIQPKTGRIHTSFNQTVAATGRLSSNDPNLQNIPIRTDLGKEIRRAFVPRNSDYIILSADYSQIELRIMASICGDPALVSAFKNEEDIHRSTAAHVFMVSPEDVTPDMRRKAKEVNFGILYGIGPFGLKTRLGITQQHAKEIIETYFNTFKRVKNFMDDSVLHAKEKGYAETLLGRRRFLPNINSNNRVVRQFEERVAINMPIQGTAADMIKLAMINVYKYLTENKFRSKMVLQVHDELLFDVHKDELNEIRPILKELMEAALPLNVPVIVETGVGDNWLDAH
ncbi:MAG: DNA polymerase I [Ignavibacteriaceae bacterium]|nr:DNA polymerase I [Ignavibacteriaceae bacterium]